MKGRDVELVILEDENEVATVVANRLAALRRDGLSATICHHALLTKHLLGRGRKAC